MVALSTLPNEILSLITNYLDHPKDVRHLSLTCHRLHQFVEIDGWNAYLAGRFGITAPFSEGRTTVHGITTLYRNWDRKAFLARYIEPSSRIISLNTWQQGKWENTSAQTMGYQPSIDSYEDTQGWTNRREVLTWSAGRQLAMRIKETGSRVPTPLARIEEQDGLDIYKHRATWYTYQIPDSREGIDDITALRLLRPSQHNDSSEYIAFGTASGQLSLLEVNLNGHDTKTHYFKTHQEPVGSLSISPHDKPLMATIRGPSLTLYPVHFGAEDEDLSPLDEINPRPSSAQNIETTRPWTCNFIAQNRIAVGLGPSLEPVEVFGVQPDGMRPLRRFGVQDQYAILDSYKPVKTSVYPVAPLRLESQAGTDPGNVFLSGAYDGYIRLHDMRSPNDFERLISDETNGSPVYSLVTQGLERVIAGVSQHSMLKVFDLRFSGSHAYSYPLPDSGHKGAQPSNDWNLFLHPRHQESRPGQQRRGHRIEDSPVYSLSLPSATSPSLYAGVEGAIMGLDFLSVMDPYPDPLFSGGVKYLPNFTPDIERSYNLTGDVLSLGMYERVGEHDTTEYESPSAVTGSGPRRRLVVQEDVTGAALAENAEKRAAIQFVGLDERWKDPSEEGKKWIRGQVPQGQPEAQSGRGGRGRGGRRGQRGRGRS